VAGAALARVGWLLFRATSSTQTRSVGEAPKFTRALAPRAIVGRIPGFAANAFRWGITPYEFREIRV
jgi:hypothetical protein